MPLLWLTAGILCAVALHYLLKLLQRETPGERRLTGRVLLIIAGGVVALVLLRFGLPSLAAILSAFIALTALLNRLSIWLPLLRFFRAKRPAAPAETMSVEQAARILGISADASEDDIRAAWHKLMQQCHPDKGGNDYLAQQLNQAKETLIQHHKGKT